MKKTSNLLIVVGGIITLTPFLYMYLTHRLIAETMQILLVQRPELNKVDIKPLLPDYYIPVCLIVGIVCIAVGIFYTLRSGRQDAFERI